MEGGQPPERRLPVEKEEMKIMLARALDMNELELRATLITIITKTNEAQLGYLTVKIIQESIDLSYNPYRRPQTKPL
jgi:hypothetical protein